MLFLVYLTLLCICQYYLLLFFSYIVDIVATVFVTGVVTKKYLAQFLELLVSAKNMFYWKLFCPNIINFHHFINGDRLFYDNSHSMTIITIILCLYIIRWWINLTFFIIIIILHFWVIWFIQGFNQLFYYYWLSAKDTNSVLRQSFNLLLLNWQSHS